MVIQNRILLLIFIAAGMIVVFADFKNVLKTNKIKCRTGEKYLNIIQNCTCSVKAVNRRRAVINFNTFLTRPFDDFLIHIQLFKKNSVRYLPFIFNVTIDACKYLGGKDSSIFFARFILNWIKEYSNFNHSCPYSGHVITKNFEPFIDKFPGLLPEGEFRLDVILYEHHDVKNLMIFFNFFGTITNRPLISRK